MLLNDRLISLYAQTGRLGITPFSEANVQPASIDLLLGNEFRIMDVRHQPGKVDPYDDNSSLYTALTIDEGTSFTLFPGSLVLGTTIERITLPADIQGKLDGKSSLARLGVMVHQTGGFFDPGFDGTATLEFSCVACKPVKLWPGMPIAQMSFEMLIEPSERPYGHPERRSKYQGQDGATPPRFHQNRRPEEGD